MAIKRIYKLIINDYGKSNHLVPKNMLNNVEINEKPIIILTDLSNMNFYLEKLLKIAIEKKNVLIFTKKIDIYQPKIIETYIDSIFSTQIIIDNTINVMNFVKKNHLNLQQINSENLKSILMQSYKNKTVFLIGDLVLE